MIVNADDFRDAARRRLPKIFFDYIDGGSFGETTLRRNRDDFDRWALEQCVLRGSMQQDLCADILGHRAALPLMLGPVGFLGLYRRDGEIAAARAAATAGIPWCLSTFSIRSIGSVARAAGGEGYFQLYILDDRGLTEELLAGAERAGAGALFVTVDTAITGIREKDVRNGFRAATRLTPAMLMNMATRPAWCLDVLGKGTPSVEAVDHRAEFGRGALEQAANLSRRIDKTLSWADVAWLRERWNGKLVIKGILTAADAQLARSTGADAIVISNHGGRQLDAAPSTISALPEIAEQLGGEIDILIDGAFRRGSDVIKALALGASGVMLGRSYAFALAAGGEAGVAKLLNIFRTELTINLALMGLDSVDALRRNGRSAVRFLDAPRA
ncbi:FMN-dependent dehydrogenase, includes L-lactate dehydrogenase and type II isopentenyl diphosphate isomerase [Kaistia soli DSM 19436]|uniref:FMN-dependent dehydrogenase, includes L-lactate dehydrogenase and type II isopentenyl diphosphate isomerase n=1 Tax=Kaistia soli DSM 19436 TaxID=1122133 RepID=A0A1M5DI97_9HYPH|nr:alpha-hydroxy acid oxidase [Kaistia soli]SHF66748.1 FMN-dependent dehydrogenase, includes L-lactate dehydrogenase and type II isopentenyl diphosphate isomerase [Kaistia soli DSM 19436]